MSDSNIWQFPVGVNAGFEYTCAAGWKSRTMIDLAVIPTAGKRKTRIVSITDIEPLVKKFPYYSLTNIDMAQYPEATNANEKVTTVGMLATFVTSAKVPDDVVYAITKEVFENLDEFKKLHPALEGLTRETMLEGLTAPIHPGALKYYKEAGLMK